MRCKTEIIIPIGMLFFVAYNDYATALNPSESIVDLAKQHFHGDIRPAER
jgi:hypothetical protein